LEGCLAQLQNVFEFLFADCGECLNGQTFVLEAVQPVKLTPLNVWINNGKNKHFVVKRYINALKENQIHNMELVGQKMIGKRRLFLALNWFF
jgi:hypothetical protein